MIRIVSLMLLLIAAGRACAVDVKGYGRTPDDAKRDARQSALEKLQQRFNLPDLLSPWNPTLADVDALLEDRRGEAGPSIDVKELGVQHCWILRVRFPSDEEIERRSLAAKRQGTSSAALAFVAACLCAWWGWTSFRTRMREPAPLESRL